jgi:hypothetical protein
LQFVAQAYLTHPQEISRGCSACTCA